MVARILVTLVLLLFAAGGFFSSATEPVGPLNPFGILFLFLSGVVWFAWDLVREAFANRLDVMAMRLGPMFRHKPVVDPIAPAKPEPAERKRAKPKP